MNKLQANLCLLCVTFCWSTEVVIFAIIPNSVSPFATTCITFLIGGILLTLAFYKRIRDVLRREWKKILLRCIFLSVLNGAYNTMYQFGLEDFDVSTGAFTLSLTVVALPIILVVQRTRVEKRTWISSAIVMLGIIIALSSVMSREQLSGLTVIGIGCVLRAFYIIKLNQYAREHDPVVLAALICLLGGAISYFGWLYVQPSTFLAISWSPTIIASMAIYGYFVVALTFTLNNYAQRRTTAANATIIYSLEIVFSVLWGALLPASLITQVYPTWQIIAGVVCVVIGNLIVLLEFDRKRKAGREAVT